MGFATDNYITEIIASANSPVLAVLPASRVRTYLRRRALRCALNLQIYFIERCLKKSQMTSLPLRSMLVLPITRSGKY